MSKPGVSKQFRPVKSTNPWPISPFPPISSSAKRRDGEALQFHRQEWHAAGGSFIAWTRSARLSRAGGFDQRK